MIIAKIAAVLTAVVALTGALLTAGSGTAQALGPFCAPGDPNQTTAELFATTNTATITDPADPRLSDQLTLFDTEVRLNALMELGTVNGSEPVDGVFWSDQNQQITYETSRRFDLACTGSENLCWIADDLRLRHNQEAVLGIAYLPPDNERSDGFLVRVPGVDVTRLHDALLTDPVARDRLVGGSVTRDGTLILVADRADLDVTRSFVEGLGAQWDPSAVRYGDRELVTDTCIQGVLF